MLADYTLIVKTKGEPMTKEETTAALPCPFCGGQATIIDDASICVPMVYVECLQCHAHGPELPKSTARHELRKAALSLWNGRASNMLKEVKS